MERRERLIVGVNDQSGGARAEAALFANDPEVERRECEQLAQLRRARDEDRLQKALRRLEADAQSTANIVPATIEAVRAYATIGEICGVLRSVWGEHQERLF